MTRSVRAIATGLTRRGVVLIGSSMRRFGVEVWRVCGSGVAYYVGCYKGKIRLMYWLSIGTREDLRSLWRGLKR